MVSNQHDPFDTTFGTLESFVDRVSEVLQCPVTLEDAHHHLLAYSRHNDYTDVARIETIIRRRVPEKIIYRLWKNGVMPTLLSTKEPLFIEENPDIGLGARAAVSIWHNEEVLGFIWVQLFNKRLNSTSLNILKKAATVAKGLLLQHQRNKQNTIIDSQELFWKMLTGHKVDERKILSAVTDLKTPIPSTFTVAIFRFTDFVNEPLEQKAAYFFEASEKVYVPFYTIDGNDIVVLVGTNTQFKHEEISYNERFKVFKDFIHMFQKNMLEHVGVVHLHVGFGGIYHHFEYVSNSYQEAKIVLEVKQTFPEDTNDIYSYQELGIYQFLDVLLKERSQRNMDNVVVKKLLDYDYKNKTQLTETLKIYLDKNENPTETANYLHIHVNTLSYRLKRITEITGIDLSKPNQKFMVYLDLKLLHWQKKQEA